MGKYKKPKVQNLKDQRSLIKPSVSSLNNKSSEVLIEVDGQFHTNTAIQRIINETLEDYKKKLSENKWILSQKQKQHLTLYYTYKEIIKKKMIIINLILT